MVAHRETAATSAGELGALMIGRALAGVANAAAAAPGRTMLEVDALEVRDALGIVRVRDVTLAVRAGEMLGIAGVSGNGQTELIEALAGMRPASAGSIRVQGQAVQRASPDRLRAMGVAHIPEDRLRTGLVPAFAARESAMLGHQDEPGYRRGPLLDWRGIERHTAALMRDYDVRPPNPRLRTALFSGGNQQKLILAREIERRPAVLLVGQPTRGVDIGGIEFDPPPPAGAARRRLRDPAGLRRARRDPAPVRPDAGDVRRPHRRRDDSGRGG